MRVTLDNEMPEVLAVLGYVDIRDYYEDAFDIELGEDYLTVYEYLSKLSSDLGL